MLANSASTLATNLLSITVLIWVQQYLVKRVPLEEYSLLPVIYSLMIFLPLLTTILTSGIKRYVVEAYAQNDLLRITRIVTSIFPLLCLAGITLAVIGSIVAFQIDQIVRIEDAYLDDAQLMLILLFAIEIIRLALAGFSSGLYVKQRFVLQNQIKVVTECIRLAALFYLLLYVSVSVVWVVVSTAIGTILETTALYVVSRKLVPAQRIVRSAFDWSIVKHLTTFGGWSSLQGFSSLVRKAADPIILNRFSTPLEVSCFHLGGLVPNRLEVLLNQSILGSVSPVIVGLNSDGQHEQLKTLYLRIGRLAMWVALLVVSPFLVHYEQVAILYVGNSFVTAGTVLALLLACYPFVYGNILHTSLANAQLKIRSLALRETFAASINLTLTITLVWHYQLGAIGAAVATFLVYGLGSLVIFWPFGATMARASFREICTETLIPGLAPMVIAIAIMKLLSNHFETNTWITIAANSALGAAVYCFAALLVAKDSDRTQLQAALSTVLNRR